MQGTFFYEVSEFYSQGVALINYFFGTCQQFINYAIQTQPVQNFFVIVNQFPAEYSAIIAIIVSMTVFDFFRGR